MSVKVTVELPEELAQRARAVAAQSSRRVEDVLLEWIDRAGSEQEVDSLSDDQLLALCDGQLDDAIQNDLSELLARSREGRLADAERDRLEGLMQLYRRGLVRKARAWKAAVGRGLRAPLS